MKKISVIVPCYKDELNVEELYRRLKETLVGISDISYEIIYINDDSPDKSGEILNNLVEKEKDLFVIHHTRNFGLMSVYDTGLRFSTGDCAVLMDGDLQDPPELISKFVELWREGYEVVYAYSEKRKEKWYRKIGYRLFYKVWNKLSTINIPEGAGDFGLIDRVVIDSINSLPEKERFYRGLRAWVGYKQIGVGFVRDGRFAGETTQSMFKYVGWAFLAITSFSYLPLKLISVLALITTFCSIIWLFCLLVMFVFGVRGPEGYMMLVSLVLLLGSCTLLSLSIIAEYLIRIFNEVKSRPTSLVGEVRSDGAKFFLKHSRQSERILVEKKE